MCNLADIELLQSVGTLVGMIAVKYDMKIAYSTKKKNVIHLVIYREELFI